MLIFSRLVISISAFGVSGYALSPLFYAEFSSLPQHIAQHVQSLVTATVDGKTRGDRRSKGGVPSAFQVGSPREAYCPGPNTSLRSMPGGHRCWSTTSTSQRYPPLGAGSNNHLASPGPAQPHKPPPSMEPQPRAAISPTPP